MPQKLLVPREHGAWVMLLLPFLVGAASAGDGFTWRLLAATFAVLSIFLLRVSLLNLFRPAFRARASISSRREGQQEQSRHARFSTAVYGIVAAASTLALILMLPFRSLVAAAAAPILFLVAGLHPWLQRRQYALWFELVSVAVLTSSALLGYLAATGEWRANAVWIWLLFAAEMATSILVVRAQLGFPAVEHKSIAAPAAVSSLRVAVAAETLLWLGLAALSLWEHSLLWLPLAFLPPSGWHGWILWRLAYGHPRMTPRRLGLAELSVSMIFSLLVLLNI